MSSLFGSLSIALRSLLAQQGALATTNNNIANVNTPGYSRQRPVLREESRVFHGSVLLGTGVTIESVQSIRDRILELRTEQETQQQGRLEAFLDSMQQVQGLFNETQGTGLEGVLSQFFDSFAALSANPTSSPLRGTVLTAAENLATAFRRSAQNLATLQTNLDKSVTQAVNSANQLIVEIAHLNRQVAGLESTGQDAGALLDQRNALIRGLAKLVDLAAIDAKNGSLTLTTTNGTALVVGEKSFGFDLRLDPATGFQRIFSQRSDITAALTGGNLAGLLEARDLKIPAALADLDSLAAGLAAAVNAQHRLGFDLAGIAGGNFFTPSATTAGAAANLTVAITDPAQVAASSEGTPGSNGNANWLSALRDQAVVAGQKPVDFYTNLLFRIGNDVQNASTELEAESLILRQLQNQRSAVSGVSLDEESTNLLRYQRAFEAAARVVSAVNELTDVAINFGRY